MTENQLKRGDFLELGIDDLAFGGRGVARMGEFVWLVDKGIPGQKVKARIRNVRKHFGECIVEEVIDPSPHQVDPPCPYFGTCGGCQLQHLDYSIQVEAKTRQIKEIIKRIAGIPDTNVVHPALPAEKIYGYRNKMEFTFSDRPWLTDPDSSDKQNAFALGLHVPGRFDKVLDIDACLLQTESANQIFSDVKNLIKETALKPYVLKTHTGFWRFLVIREGQNTGDLMLDILTSGMDPEKGKQTLDWVMHKLFWKHLELTTAIHGTTDRKSQTAYAESERLLLGMGKITEKIGDRVFEISPNTFFQTNTLQAARLFSLSAELADFQGGETVYDLYCGSGAIGIVIADNVKQVVGIEAIASAVKDGKRNLELNNISNVEFVLADMKDALHDGSIPEKYGQPDVVILDPPRGGTHPKTVQDLLGLAPPKIVYISCNPPMLAKDLKILCEDAYTLKTVQPVDMFPHTGHIEVVALLIRKTKSL